MSLKSFHLLFIVLACLLCFAFGAWTLVRETTDYRALGVVAIILGIGLIAYGVWFVRKIRTPEEERQRRRSMLRPLAVAGLLGLADAPEALACSTCYGDAEGPLIDAAKLGVWLLFGLVVCVQASFGVFFVQLWRRARRYRDHEGVRS